MADLKITGLHKYYGEVHAVKGVDLVIPAGEFTILVGQSGCGKSTLLRTIAGLEDADAGTIEIGGEVVNDQPPRERFRRVSSAAAARPSSLSTTIIRCDAP
jgi:multiple sugar transport system ATP-binding protein